ncbi:MAG: DUF1572 family protein [Flavobacteriaceae bacterium]|nr:DUF1572 family protein [Flavobacteriaceae bacterium]
MKSYLSSVTKLFEYYQQLGIKTFDQVNDEEIDWKPGEEENSISIIAKHIVGNLRSRWTNFLNEDGEKKWRNRDDEFVASYQGKAEMTNEWNKAFSLLYHVLSELDDTDLEREVFIRNEGHTVVEAINRQLAHYSYHVGQIVQIGKMIKGKNWKTLSIPRGQSEAYNKKKIDEDQAHRHFTDDL